MGDAGRKRRDTGAHASLDRLSQRPRRPSRSRASTPGPSLVRQGLHVTSRARAASGASAADPVEPVAPARSRVSAASSAPARTTAKVEEEAGKPSRAVKKVEGKAAKKA